MIETEYTYSLTDEDGEQTIAKYIMRSCGCNQGCIEDTLEVYEDGLGHPAYKAELWDVPGSFIRGLLDGDYKIEKISED